MCLRPRDVARALCKLVEPAPPKRRVPLLEVTLPGGDRLTLPFTSNEYVESQAHGRPTEGGDVGDEPSRGRPGLFDTGEGGPEEVCRLNGGKVREIVSGLRLPDLRALAATWPGPDE